MAVEKELNDRKRAILKSIIDDYIQSAHPVGSRTIARKHELGLGSATIRNEMADLEELGYITQPHTSAGRIPSDKGYRFYVDHLMQIHNLAQEEIASIRRAMDERIEEINQLIKKVSVILSDITGYTSVVMSPQFTRAVIKSVKLVAVDEKRLLVVVLASGGIVKDKLIKHNFKVDEDIVARLNQAFNNIMANRTMDQISKTVLFDVQRHIQVPELVVMAVMDAIEDCVRKIETADIYLEGITNILNYPEFSDLIKAREILDTLREEEVLMTLVKKESSKQYFEFRIGSENEIDEMKNLSVITAKYGSEDKSLGTIGVIGPTRMAYGKVVSSIKYIRELLNKEILKILGDDS